MYILFEAAHSEKSLQCSKIIYICMYINIYKYKKRRRINQSFSSVRRMGLEFASRKVVRPLQKACASKWGLGPGGLAHEYLLRELSWEPPESVRCRRLLMTPLQGALEMQRPSPLGIPQWISHLELVETCSGRCQTLLFASIASSPGPQPPLSAPRRPPAGRRRPPAQATHRGRRRYRRCAPLVGRGGAGAAARPQAK